MNDETLVRVFNKARMLRELHRARIRVLQLERQLRGEPTEVEQEPEVPAFLTRARPAETSSAHRGQRSRRTELPARSRSAHDTSHDTRSSGWATVDITLPE